MRSVQIGMISHPANVKGVPAVVVNLWKTPHSDNALVSRIVIFLDRREVTFIENAKDGAAATPFRKIKIVPLHEHLKYAWAQSLIDSDRLQRILHASELTGIRPESVFESDPITLPMEIHSQARCRMSASKLARIRRDLHRS